MLCNGKFPKGFLQNLENLRVEICDELEDVFQTDEFCCSGGQNQPHLPKGSPPYFSLQSLIVVRIFNCGKLKSVFSPSLIQSLLQLEELQVQGCNELKTLFTELENDGGETESRSHDTLHPCLPRLTTLRIFDCARLKYVLPITLARGLPQLEVLSIKNCGELKTVFTEWENDGGETESSSHDLRPLCLPRLRTLTIYNCATLEYVLPVTSAQGLPQLKTVYVSECGELKQVFGVSKGQDGVQHCIKLPLLNDLELKYIPNLTSFGPENCIVKSLALKELIVSGCPQLMRCTNQEEVNNHWLHLQKNLTPEVEGLTSLELNGCEVLECLVDTTKENVPICVMFTNLVELHMERINGLKMLCNGEPPNGFLQNLEILTVDGCMDIVSLYPLPQNLKKLSVEYCKKLQEVFGIEELLYSRKGNQAPLLSTLESLRLDSVPELRWILKCPTQYVSLRNLKDISVENCNKLESLFSFSLVQSLRLLEKLWIRSCDKLEMVFADETQSNELLASAQSDLPCLQELQLHRLTNLSSFGPVGCHLLFQSLKMLEINDCSQMITSFSIDSTSTVHAQTKAPRLDDTSPSSKPNICWTRYQPTSGLRDPYISRRRRRYISRTGDELTELPPYVEEADEISAMK